MMMMMMMMMMKVLLRVIMKDRVYEGQGIIRTGNNNLEFHTLLQTLAHTLHAIFMHSGLFLQIFGQFQHVMY